MPRFMPKNVEPPLTQTSFTRSQSTIVYQGISSFSLTYWTWTWKLNGKEYRSQAIGLFLAGQNIGNSRLRHRSPMPNTVLKPTNVGRLSYLGEAQCDYQLLVGLTVGPGHYSRGSFRHSIPQCTLSSPLCMV